MRISEQLGTGKRSVSFEFFPPKSGAGERTLFRSIRSLQELQPSFVSVTCGAGGSTRVKTVDYAVRIKEETGIEPMVHMTCLGVPEAELTATIMQVREAGLMNILALRGDRPIGESADVYDGGPCRFASDLVGRVRGAYPEACVAAACYPEVHAEAASKSADLHHLKEKADAGVDFFITQLFFDNRHYFEFVGRARSLGITQPIIPGIMPIQNVGQTKRFTEMCGATLPPSLLKLLEQYQESPSAVFYIGVAHAVAQVTDLIANGAPGVHFYTLNKSPATRLVVEALRKDGVL